MLYFPSFTMPSLFPQKLHATFLVLTTESPNFMLYSFPLTICTGGGKAQFVMSQWNHSELTVEVFKAVLVYNTGSLMETDVKF